MTTKRTQSPPEQLARALESMLPTAQVRLDRPDDVGRGIWYVDAELEGHSVTIEWAGGRGFGVSARADTGYGERVDERHLDVEATLERVADLLQSQSSTTPPATTLAELRLENGLSQVQLADFLDIQQSAVSKLEHRQDLHLSTISSVVHALGGELDLTVRFPDGRVRKLVL